ncbi:Retrovirus-related Pol polyprotein from transposon opus [Vitis vinifera]|uniref:Retrovirus-related Pol polyprotein from transposon opus n=1 Tax=Vitis vinifera TaxID=29760 RepID=A0A438C5E6_VITVI|nr:Retrovirus-related Pol polyprotein from transposon opus [Vitis vinifera]
MHVETYPALFTPRDKEPSLSSSEEKSLEEVETPSFPIRRQAPDVKYPEKVECQPDRIPDVGYPEKMERRKGDRLLVHGVGTPPPDDTERASLSGSTPSGFPKRIRGALPYSDSLKEKHATLAIITPRTIAYPIRICCHDHCPILLAFRICLWQRTSKLRFFMFLSFPLLCHGFQRTLLNLGLLCTFEECLVNLEAVLNRCIEKDLVLNWEKCHFMVQQGIALGHIISKKGIEVDKAKVELIIKLPSPTTVKEVRQFLGHVGFYRKFIKDLSKLLKPLCELLVRAPNWQLPFEVMCDASDFAIGAVRGQREDETLM